jgi:hypothetical protein
VAATAATERRKQRAGRWRGGWAEGLTPDLLASDAVSARY